MKKLIDKIKGNGFNYQAEHFAFPFNKNFRIKTCSAMRPLHFCQIYFVSIVFF